MTAPEVVRPSTAPGRPEPRTRAIGVLCGLVVVLLFSSFTLASRLGFASSLRLPDLAALRFVIAGLLLLPMLLHHGLTGVRWHDAVALAITGGLGFALCAYTGLSLAPASHAAALLHGSLPLFTFALTWLSSSATATRRRAWGIATILVGISAMAWDSIAGSSPLQLLGDGALLLASISWSAYGLLAHRRGLAPTQAASIVAVFSMCGFLPVYAMLPANNILITPWRELVLQGVFQGGLIGALSVLVYSRAVAILGATETALFTAAVPGVTTIAAVLLLGEMPSSLAWGGVTIVTAGMAISLNGRSSAICAGEPDDQPADFFTRYCRPVRRAVYGEHSYEAFSDIEEPRTRRGGHGDDAYRLLAELEDEQSWWGRPR